MNNEFLSKKEILDQHLEQLISMMLDEKNPLSEPIHYAIAAPGKRIRGVLTLVFCERLGVSLDQALPFAMALELIHAYSLVHDDMPEMDNDDYRRGLLTCHKKFGSDTALLAGDAILNLSMEFLLEHREKYDSTRFLDAMAQLYRASGPRGMLLGQVLDKNGEERLLSKEELLTLHRHKTGELLLAPILIAESLSEKAHEEYEKYCRHIGLAFQIKDDLLDLEGAAEILGKETGKDLAEHKSTFITVLGAEKSKLALETEIQNAMKAARDDAFLLWLAEYIYKREK